MGKAYSMGFMVGDVTHKNLFDDIEILADETVPMDISRAVTMFVSGSGPSASIDLTTMPGVNGQFKMIVVQYGASNPIDVIINSEQTKSFSAGRMYMLLYVNGNWYLEY